MAQQHSQYDPQHIEKKWQQYWKDKRTFVAELPSDKPKYYVLDMFPYPSGAGLHVGHPLGYIATDIMARYKRTKGYNVLHPMGFDSFGLPAEQYAIETGIHPTQTTEVNTARYLEQMAILGFHHDPTTLLRTSDAEYYRWTQWIFLRLFAHWYDKAAGKARPIAELEAHFAAHGNANLQAATDQTAAFSAAEWNAMGEAEKAATLMRYRMAYQGVATVNWCPGLGTVLANDEVKDGKSERGGYPVEKREMTQWMLRISAYADRLLYNLAGLDWSDSIKAQQTNWIGRSEGARIKYAVQGSDATIEVFTTRPDTLFGNTFLVLAPEHPLVAKIATNAQRGEVETYAAWAKARTEKDRTSDTTKTGTFTGAYALHPFTQEPLPIWISDYVIWGYGTGAIMAVPAHDERDFEFASKFGIEIRQVIAPPATFEGETAYTGKEGTLINSDFANGLSPLAAGKTIVARLEAQQAGNSQITYRMRDVIWSRQRYWGEPTPIVYKNGIAQPLSDSDLPLVLPEVSSYKPNADGLPPLANAAESWINPENGTRELSTMPGAAGSSWYFLRYCDANNPNALADENRMKYFMPVDLYVGGSEHAVGHLLYSRFWNMFLFDIGISPVEEPFKKLVNQGMIQGRSNFVYRLNSDANTFVSFGKIASVGGKDAVTALHVDVTFVQNDVLDVEKFRQWRAEYAQVSFILEEDGSYKCGSEIEKMSKSKYNVYTPDDIVRDHGADTLRLYEMFLGPLEQSKPWDINGIDGVSKFLRRVWNLFYENVSGKWLVTDDAPTAEELKHLHKAIKKIEEAIEAMSFNTAVPVYMVLSRELQTLKCHKRAILEPFLVLLSSFAPHLCEELWEALGHTDTILNAAFPVCNEAYLVEASIDYPVQINGKVRATLTVAADADAKAIEALALADATVQKWLDGKAPKKVIVVAGRIVNIVL